jgi:ubiquinone/menaquinone biosynthesis C-methylase UbiE
LITTYQTLEHVYDVQKCLEEMLRVLKPGGFLYIRAPNYDSFYEPHYGIPFWPKMNKKLATIYLMILGRPLIALHELNWITEKEIISLIRKLPFNVSIVRTFRFLQTTQTKKHLFQTVMWRIKRMRIMFREEKQIDLWVTKND